MRILLVILFTLLHPGIAQIYNGRRWKGIGLIGITFIVTAFKLSLGFIPVALLYIIGIIDAIVDAVRLNKGQIDTLEGKNIWVEVVVALIIAVPVTYMINEFVTKEDGEGLTSPAPQSEQITQADQQKVQKEAIAYLKKKYKRDFTVWDVEYVWQTDKYLMKAKAKTEPDVTFSVIQSDKQFKDTLLGTLWSEQAKQELTPVFQKSFPQYSSFRTEIGFDPSLKNQAVQGGKIPDYKEIRQRSDDYNQHITVYVIRTLTRNNQTDEMKKVLRFINYLNKNNINATIEIRYYHESLLQNGVKQVNIDNEGDHINFLQYMFESDDVSQVKTLKDVEAGFRSVK
ncbi:hypothetical protein GCM10011571_24460 [Marinithermofilum abyssi]|uniref:TM2 domain-containing protein n=1 Tax=Marinithermofilum abyssi TaxID=1571185 RepID=A0A8J2YDY2_9BACL|nr:hypothetical protein [Marinithermofilum abyssi]GGE21493.1 hypothetical protein GCM10011571_24460 [Marinithermofilum abyssi]